MTSLADLPCRSCEAPGLQMVLSLGKSPLANALLAPADLAAKEPLFPLDLVFCPSCAMVQITETVPPEVLFADYLYFSSFSDTMLKHAETIATRMVAEERLGPDSLVVEIASNDGYLLQYYKRAGVPVLGIEPAKNVARVAESERGIPTLTEFFGRELAAKLRAEGKLAHVLHANNVLAHVADLNGVFAGIAEVLAPHGVAVIEVAYVRDMVDKCEFDTIYHEHLCYHSVTALDHLLTRHGLVLRDVERISMHGGSLRLFAMRADAAERGATTKALLAEERELGVDRLDYYRGFAKRVEGLKAELLRTLGDLRAKGKRVAGYGAAAKATTLLNYLGVGPDTVEFVVDRSPHKQGRTIPGARVPIVAPDALKARAPDYCLLLAWNMSDEILRQQDEYRKAGGKFIVPVPAVRIV